MMQVFRDNARFYIPWPINVWTARLLGAELALMAIVATVIPIAWLVHGGGITGN
jgi:hypothetical protein